MNKLEKVKAVYHLLRDSVPNDAWLKLAGLRLAKEIVEAIESRSGEANK